MSYMFAHCESLTVLDVSGFDTGNVTNMLNMFSGCSGLTELDVSGFDTGNVTDMSDMFSDCSSLTELDVSGFDTGNVTDMSFMFADCENLTELDVSGFDTGNVTDMSYMFYGCEDLLFLDTSNFDMSGVLNDATMFENCPAGKIQFLGSDWPALQRGDEGEWVHFLQVELVERNFLYDAADGIYGAKTEQAVSALQEMAGLPQTGAMDEATWRALTRHEARFEPQSGIGLLLYDVEMTEGGWVYLYFKNMGDQTATGYEFEVRQCNASKSVIGISMGVEADLLGIGMTVWKLSPEKFLEIGSRSLMGTRGRIPTVKDTLKKFSPTAYTCAPRKLPTPPRMGARTLWTGRTSIARSSNSAAQRKEDGHDWESANPARLLPAFLPYARSGAGGDALLAGRALRPGAFAAQQLPAKWRHERGPGHPRDL